MDWVPQPVPRGTLVWEAPVSGPGTTRLWSGTHPSAVLPTPFFVVPATPCSHLWSARLQLTLILAHG